jgi:hypothetical protein
MLEKVCNHPQSSMKYIQRWVKDHPGNVVKTTIATK